MSRLDARIVTSTEMSDPAYASVRTGVQAVFESSGLATGAVFDTAVDLAATHVAFLQQGRRQEIVTAATLMRDGRHELEVVLMATSPQHTGRGYASALLGVVEHVALQDKTGLRMSVEPHRLAMRSLILNRGYHGGGFRGLGGEFAVSFDEIYRIHRP